VLSSNQYILSLQLEHLQSKLDKANEQLESEVLSVLAKYLLLKMKWYFYPQKNVRLEADRLDPNNVVSVLTANDRLSKENARLHRAVLELDKRRHQVC
jgi:hypothetical protein